MKSKLKSLLNLVMINRLYRLIKESIRKARKGGRFAKALIYYVFWFVFGKYRLYKQLKRIYHLDAIKAFCPLSWRHGTKYFEANKDNESLFIKVSGIVNTTKRELYAISEAGKRSDFLKEHIPSVVTGDTAQDRVVVERKIQGISLDKIEIISEEEEYIIVHQIYKIYEELTSVGIVHMDIRPANFMVEKDGHNIKVVLIDFGYALVDSTDVYEYIGNSKIAKGIIKRLGSDCALMNGTWDDAYSFLVTLKKVCPSLIQKYYDIWRILNERIGINVVMETCEVEGTL